MRYSVTLNLTLLYRAGHHAVQGTDSNSSEDFRLAECVAQSAAKELNLSLWRQYVVKYVLRSVKEPHPTFGWSNSALATGGPREARLEEQTCTSMGG